MEFQQVAWNNLKKVRVLFTFWYINHFDVNSIIALFVNNINTLLMVTIYDDLC